MNPIALSLLFHLTETYTGKIGTLAQEMPPPPRSTLKKTPLQEKPKKTTPRPSPPPQPAAPKRAKLLLAQFPKEVSLYKKFAPHLTLHEIDPILEAVHLEKPLFIQDVTFFASTSYIKLHGPFFHSLKIAVEMCGHKTAVTALDEMNPGHESLSHLQTAIGIKEMIIQSKHRLHFKENPAMQTCTFYGRPFLLMEPVEEYIKHPQKKADLWKKLCSLK
ncbi:MAG: hypothetical protein A3F09_00735 [Chlamydiae bacterium RIFCSPHIGHO2_12_FULL_49_11]|nr:MAG: hypothetical protein A3F09_00735 [Chlamydiae bacterium RIFCSPHIGHO2_12_FULL_49_11]